MNNQLMQSFNSDKLMNNMFRRADGVVWDLMTGKVGVQTDAGIVTLEGEGENAQVNVNPLDGFGMALPAFAQSTPVADIKVGDIIYRGARDKISFIIEKKDNGKFRVINPDGTQTTWGAPKVTVLGFDTGVMVLRSLVSMFPDGDKSLGDMQGMLMPIMMMGDGALGGDLEKMLPLVLMSQAKGVGGNTMGPMLQQVMMMKAMGGLGGGNMDMEKMLPMLMMMGGMGGNGGGMNMMPLLMMQMMSKDKGTKGFR